MIMQIVIKVRQGYFFYYNVLFECFFVVSFGVGQLIKIEEFILFLCFYLIFLVVRCVFRLYVFDGGIIDCNKNNIYGLECFFICNIGYNRIGLVNRVCESNYIIFVGYWIGNEVRC